MLIQCDNHYYTLMEEINNQYTGCLVIRVYYLHIIIPHEKLSQKVMSHFEKKWSFYLY